MLLTNILGPDSHLYQTALLEESSPISRLKCWRFEERKHMFYAYWHQKLLYTSPNLEVHPIPSHVTYSTTVLHPSEMAFHLNTALPLPGLFQQLMFMI